MPIVAADITYRFSVAAAAGDTTAGTAPTSLGDQVSTTAWADAATLFDDISGAENAASVVDYRCVFPLNNHATLTAQAGKIYLASEVAGGASAAVAVDDIAASAKTSASAQAAAIGSETTAPSGVGAFSSPTTDAGGISIGDLAPAEVRGVWVRRTAANSAALNADGFTFGYGLDTGA